RGRRLGERRQHRRLRQVYLIDTASEEVSARRLDSVNAVPHVDDVEIELEDLLFGQRMLDETRQSELGQFLSQRARRILAHRERIARHLHGDGAESFAGVAGFQVGDKGAEETAPLEATVLVD